MKLELYFLVIFGYWIKNGECVPPLQMICFPVEEAMCTESVNHNFSPRFKDNENASPAHRKSTGKRNVQEMDLIHWPYNNSGTVYPSFADDKSSAEVKTSFSYLHPLIATKCSRYIKLFLCSVHTPVCTPRGIVPPCRELCKQVKSECEPVAEMFNIDWPDVANCDLFPHYNPVRGCADNVKTEALAAPQQEDEWTVVHRTSSIVWAEALLDNGQVCIPPLNLDVVRPALERLDNCENKENKTKTEIELKITCPPNLKAPSDHNGYTFMGLPNCSAPCPNMYLKDNELWGIRYFVLVMAVLCIMVTSFTLLTYAINTKRYRYPERPIVFYAFSYLVVSVVFLLGFLFREDAACYPKVIDENNEIVQGFVVVEGSGHRLCSTLFLILYYFTVNGTIWWLILTITWLLAAGYKWSTEAIEERRLYYHAAAWGIPAVQILVVLVFDKIEGDNITGVCYVGLYDSSALHNFVLIPMGLYLLIGIGILFLGFFYLNGVRQKLDGDERNKEKLAKFMLRIGVFSILYIIPQIALIAIYAVEDSKRKFWESTWYAESCADRSFPCPISTHPIGMLAQDPQHPGVLLFCFKYMMTLIVALPPLFWVASKKTLKSWKLFFMRRRQPNPVYNTTQTRLLTDTDGPHARDCLAKMQGKFSAAADPAVFNEMCKSNLCGSSASVAAQPVSKRKMNALQQQWEDYTDSESSTYYSTSSLDSEMSRVLELESRRNRGTRIIGRKGIPLEKQSYKPTKNSRATDSRMSATEPHTNNKLQNLGERKMVKQSMPMKSGMLTAEQRQKLTLGPTLNEVALERTNSPPSLTNINCKPTHSQSLQKLENASSKILQAERSKSASPHRHILCASTPTTSQISSPSNISGEAQSQTLREKYKKAHAPPPPPRVDSAITAKKKSSERMLSI